MAEPRLGAIWTLTANVPRPGELVVIAGAGPSGGFLVARLVSHLEDEALGYIPITPEQVRWHSHDGPVVPALACMLFPPVAREGLDARVGVVAPAVQDALADAVRRTSARG